MKKIIILVAVLLSACTKQSSQLHSNNVSDSKRVVSISIDTMCFDGTNYHVNYGITGLRSGDQVQAGCTFGIDTLSNVSLMPRDGHGIFVAGTRESGCGVKIYILVIGKYGTKFMSNRKGNCVRCATFNPNQNPNPIDPNGDPD